MTRLLGVLLMVLGLYAVLLASNANARTLNTQGDIADRLGFYGILTVGVAVLIISGGIDLSIGSVVGLGAVCYGLLLQGHNPQVAALITGIPAAGLALLSILAIVRAAKGAYGFLLDHRFLWWLAGLIATAGATVAVSAVLIVVYLSWSVGSLVVQQLLGALNPWVAMLFVLAGSALLGLCHGLLVTKLRLQPFLVTLCGLFIYRGLARWCSSTSVGLAVDASPAFLDQIEVLRNVLVKGQYIGIPQVLVLLVMVSILLGLFLHGTRYGRYLYAIGANEEAARYAGIPTDRYKILAYVICSTLAGLGSVLYILDNRTATPTSAGSWLELYAITGAVLGGCSLRGGEGTIPGAFLGAAVLPLLRMLCSFGGISNEIEYAVIGAVLLVGTILDEMLKRRAAQRG
jgi:ribose transport system permease protein